jgi:uncharacterized membrane protein
MALLWKKNVHFKNHTKVLSGQNSKLLVLYLAMNELSTMIQSLMYASPLNLQWTLYSCIHISTNKQVIYIYIYVYVYVKKLGYFKK